LITILKNILIKTKLKSEVLSYYLSLHTLGLKTVKVLTQTRMYRTCQSFIQEFLYVVHFKTLRRLFFFWKKQISLNFPISMWLIQKSILC